MLALTRAWPGGVFRATCLMLVGLTLAGCGINTIPTLDEKAKAS
jgi:LemA protein